MALLPPSLRVVAWLTAMLPALLAAATIELPTGEPLRGEVKWQPDGALAVKTVEGKDVALAPKAWRRVAFGRPKIFDLPGLDASGLDGVSPEYVVGLPPGIITADGSFVAGVVTAGDDSAFTLREGSFSLSNLRVGVVLFQHMTPKRLAKLGGGRRGVLLRNGDFVDGEFHSLAGGVLKVNSVLFGLRSLSTTLDLAAVVVRPVAPISAEYEVRLLDGSIVLARTLDFAGNQVQFRDLAWQRLKFAPDQLSAVRRPKAGEGFHAGRGFDAGMLLAPAAKFAQFQRDRERFADEAVARFEQANAGKIKEARQTAETSDRAEAERMAKARAESSRAAWTEIESFVRARNEAESKVKANVATLRDARFALERTTNEHRIKMRAWQEAQYSDKASAKDLAEAIKWHDELKTKAEASAKDADERTKKARRAADDEKAAADKSVAEATAQLKAATEDANSAEQQLVKATAAKNMAFNVGTASRTKLDRIIFEGGGKAQ